MTKKSKQKTWLLLRGLTRGQGHWGDFPQLLQLKYPKDLILFLDLPGNGKENQRTSPWLLSEYVEFLRKNLRKNKSLGEVHVIAVSLAAMVVIEWMKTYPSEIHTAYLLNTSLKGSGSFFERIRPENYLNLLNTFKETNFFEREKMILKMTSRNLIAQEKWVKKFSEYSAEYPIHSENFFRQLVAAAQAKIPDEIPGQIKIVVSRNDNFVSSNCSFRIAKKWGVEPLVHPWAGHDLTLDDPDWFVSQLD